MSGSEPTLTASRATVPGASRRTNLRSRMAFRTTHPGAFRSGLARVVRAQDQQISIWLFVALLLLHIGLARIEKGRPQLVMLHGLAALGAALIYGTDPRRTERTLQAVAYICGAEVFWKMCGRSGTLPWEYGKVAVITVLFVALVRGNRFRAFGLPALYFALLLPSACLTFAQMDLNSSRQSLSSYLSGPLALAMSLAFMSQMRLTRQELTRIFCCFIVPVAGVAFLCYAGTFGAAEVTFGGSSNHNTSGGFGPNQVSAVLGFGVLCTLFWFLTERKGFQLRGLLLLLAFWFAIQSAMTFSRTGLYLAGLSSVAGLLPLLRDARARWTALGLATATMLLGHFLVVPWLNGFTQGALENRFRSTNLSGRDEFWTTELGLWMANPLLGVGVGVSDFTRTEFGVAGVQSHTEYTRLIAEHGVLGLAALMALMGCVYRAVRQPSNTHGKAFCWFLLTFGLLFMVVSALRLALPALALGLASARILPERRSEPNVHLLMSSGKPSRTAPSARLRQCPAQS